MNIPTQKQCFRGSPSSGKSSRHRSWWLQFPTGDDLQDLATKGEVLKSSFIKWLTRWPLRVVLSSSVLLLVQITAFSSNAYASGPSYIPPPVQSYYIPYNVTGLMANNWGKQQALTDASNGLNSVVILDFGAESADGSVTYTTDQLGSLTISQDQYIAAQFALGYQEDTNGTTVLSLEMGTNNSGSSVGYSNGQIWGNAVQGVIIDASQSGWTQVNVGGAGDWESWNGTESYAALQNWESGYTSTTSSSLYDFGSADGCPSNYVDETGVTTPCAQPDWAPGSYYMAAWGWGPAFAVPQIYYQGCTINGTPYAAQEIQWANVSLWGAENSQTMIYFTAPLWASGYCEPSPQDSYIDFWNALNNRSQTAMSPAYLAQI
jgi:hypothetical protein